MDLHGIWVICPISLWPDREYKTQTGTITPHTLCPVMIHVSHNIVSTASKVLCYISALLISHTRGNKLILFSIMLTSFFKFKISSLYNVTSLMF